MTIGTAMPASPTSSGSVSLLRMRSSPTSHSRRASSPTTRKKKAISPEFTNSCRSRVIPELPTSTESLVAQNLSYDEMLMFAQIRAATVAAARTEALPVSVRRNVRSGVSMRRTQAVFRENGPSVSSESPAVSSDDMARSASAMSAAETSITLGPSDDDSLIPPHMRPAENNYAERAGAWPRAPAGGGDHDPFSLPGPARPGGPAR